MKIKHALVIVVLGAALLTGAWPALARVAGVHPPAPLVTDSSSATSIDAEDRSADGLSVDAERAQAVLATLQAKYRHLDDLTVSIAPTPAGEQAVAYYTEGEIVISPDRSATIQRTLAHEIWHVIDWRDNGRLDWGENLPPTSAADYLK